MVFQAQTKWEVIEVVEEEVMVHDSLVLSQPWVC